MIINRSPTLEGIRERDRQAECADVTCHPGAHDRRALLRLLDAERAKVQELTASRQRLIDFQGQP
jgi:hypothetical protein